MILSKQQKIAIIFLLPLLAFLLLRWHHEVTWHSKMDEAARHMASQHFEEDAAQSSYEESLQEAQRWNDSEQISESLLGVAAAAREQKHFDEAIKFYKQALEFITQKQIGEWKTKSNYIEGEIAQLEAAKAEDAKQEAVFQKRNEKEAELQKRNNK